MESPTCHPTECDLIMEGGVTSSVVFPTFIAKLASRFDLRNIGGTSVGAVAAVTAAAAQFRRNAVRAANGTPAEAEAGYSRLETLPKWLQENSELAPTCSPVPAGRAAQAALFAHRGIAEPKDRLPYDCRCAGRLAALFSGWRHWYLARIWMSDGGLSSNFPIHFFDSLLPDSRPSASRCRHPGPGRAAWRPGLSADE